MTSLSDRELEAYRDLITPATSFSEGFTWRTALATLFIGLILLPAALYMHLMIGEASLGPAAQWVTVLLFLEVAKRARSGLKPAELLVLMAMVGAFVGATPVEGFFWRQYIVQSEAARSFGLDNAFPAWFAPSDPALLASRNFFAWEWAVPLLLMFVTQVVGRIDSLILGYGLFRLTSDVERLPFPMAPIQAAGIMALSDEGNARESWRWRCFSTGAVIGLAFSVLYIAVPTLSGLFLDQPLRILPIPWWDTTVSTQNWLPATATGISFDLANVFAGMAFPFTAVLGTFLGLVTTIVINPWLHDLGILRTWEPGMRTVDTLFANTVDFYLSFGIGLGLAVAVVGIYQSISTWKRRSGSGFDTGPAIRIQPGRGDLRPRWIILCYLGSTAFYFLLCGWLLGWQARGSAIWWVLAGFALIYVPLISYATARLEGLAGQVLAIPFVKEAAFILSGYRGLEIWLLPIPLTQNYGADAVQYRVAELVGCSFRSLWRMNAVLLPIVFLFSLIYGQFIWSLGPIPGPSYPYAQEMWDLHARNQCLVWSSTLSDNSPFRAALSPLSIAAGLGLGLAGFASLAACGAPLLLAYGLIKGLGQTIPQFIIPQLIGALLGRYVFAPRFGLEAWRRYALVLFAGFACGAGLVMVFATGLRFLAAAVFHLAY